MVKPKFKSLTNHILAMKFASEFVMIYAFYAVLFLERGNISATNIGIILATGTVLSVLFEIPTGILADKIPRKYVIMMSIISKILALGTWLIFPTFLGYLTGAALLSLGAALESGALQAYLYGTLGESAKEMFGKFWARVNSMLMIAWASSFVIAAIIGVNYPVLLMESILALCVGLILAVTLPRDSLVLASAEVKPNIFKSAITHIKHTPSLTKLLLGAVMILAVTEIWIEYISLYYYHVGVETRHIPLLLAAGSFTAAIIMWNLHKLGKYLDRYKLIIAIIMTMLFAASFLGGIVVAAAGGFIFSRYVRVMQIQFDSNIQHLANEEARATITSLAAFSAKLLAAGAIVLIGIFAVNDNIARSLRVAVIAGMTLFIFIQGILRQTSKQNTVS